MAPICPLEFWRRRYQEVFLFGYSETRRAGRVRNCEVTVGRTFVACDGGRAESLLLISSHGADVSIGDALFLVAFTNRVQVAPLENNAPMNNRALVSGELQKGGNARQSCPEPDIPLPL